MNVSPQITVSLGAAIVAKKGDAFLHANNVWIKGSSCREFPKFELYRGLSWARGKILLQQLFSGLFWHHGLAV